jgi:hypothetical protein
VTLMPRQSLSHCAQDHDCHHASHSGLIMRAQDGRPAS